MVNEIAILFICEVCLKKFEAKLLGAYPDKDRALGVAGLICNGCYIKRKSAESMYKLGFT